LPWLIYIGAMVVEVFKVKDVASLQTVFGIRKSIFVDEQNVDENEEYDGFDTDSVHFLALADGQPAGTARWRSTTFGVKLERFAVVKPLRRLGVGTSLVKAVLADLSDYTGLVYLHSQLGAITLYKKFGFKARGSEFLEAGIRHQKMVLTRAGI